MRQPPSHGAAVEQGNRQRQRILEVIADHQAQHGWAPTVREIGEAVGLASASSVQRYLVQLHERGELVLGGGPRMIRLTQGRIELRPPMSLVDRVPVGDDGRLQPGR